MHDFGDKFLTGLTGSYGFFYFLQLLGQRDRLNDYPAGLTRMRKYPDQCGGPLKDKTATNHASFLLQRTSTLGIDAIFSISGTSPIIYNM